MAFQFLPPETAFALDPTAKDQKRITDEKHLAFIRTLPSVISHRRPCEACHIRYGDAAYRKRRTPKARKPDDCWTLPLTPEEHRDQHSKNEAEWWKAQGIDPLHLARQLYEVSGDKEAAIKIIRNARKP